METKYQEISSTPPKTENKYKAEIEKKKHSIFFFCSLSICFIILLVIAYFFGHNNIYTGESEWVVSHDIMGTYGDFIGGVLGTLIALYSAFLLYRTLGSQLSVNSDIMDANITTIYQSFLQIFDNNFHNLFINYKEAKLAYQYDEKRVTKQIVTKPDNTSEKIENSNIITFSGPKALEKLAESFIEIKFTDKRTYFLRVKSATNKFEMFYSEHRREMSVHFRNLYLLVKMIGETDNVDEGGNIMLKEVDRVTYAKSIRGQLSEGEMLFLRYNCLTDRGDKMKPLVNQFNLLKHLPIMSLLEFRAHRNKISSQREINTLDSHFIILKKKLKEHISFPSNEMTKKWDFSIKYSIYFNLSDDRKKLTLKLSRLKNRPAPGSNGTPSIEKALNNFINIDDLLELYKDFMREALIVSNFELFNGPNNNHITGHHTLDVNAGYAIITYESNYSIVISNNQIERPNI